MLFMMWCRPCRTLYGVMGTIGQVPVEYCIQCEKQLTRYHGHPGAQPMVNYGYRESHYTNQTDADIAKYQFTHL